MHTCLLHSRQLCLQSAYRRLPCDQQMLRDAERFVGYYNKTSEANLKKKQDNTKSEAHFEHKRAPVLCIHVSFACNQQLAHCRFTINGSIMQSGVRPTVTENQKQSSTTQYNTKSATKSQHTCSSTRVQSYPSRSFTLFASAIK